MSKERNCWNCGYKKEIPGDAHISCVRIFDDVKPPKAKEGRYYIFPYNFDPIWQSEECKGWAKERDLKKTRQSSAMEDVFSILGRRMR